VREQDGSERDIDLHEGDFFVVPKGVEHKPVAAEEVLAPPFCVSRQRDEPHLPPSLFHTSCAQCHVMLLEKRGVLNTGNVRSQHTVDDLQRL
jgi:hypothetical protein